MEIERRNTPAGVELEARADGTAGKIRGVAAVYYRSGDPSTEFTLWEGAVERILPGAFDRAAKEDDVRGLFNHSPSDILGRTKAGTMTLRTESDGLHYTIEPSDTTVYRDVAEHLKRGDVDGSSFAFRVTQEEWRSEGKGLEVREIRGVQLFDVGPVTYPAYAGASSGFRSSDGVNEAARSYQEWRKRSAEARERVDAEIALAGILADLGRDSLTRAEKQAK